MFGEIYLLVLCAVGVVTYFHFKEQICSDENINNMDDMDDIDDLNFPIYK
jgi:hypothetical protein